MPRSIIRPRNSRRLVVNPNDYCSFSDIAITLARENSTIPPDGGRIVRNGRYVVFHVRRKWIVFRLLKPAATQIPSLKKLETTKEYLWEVRLVWATGNPRIVEVAYGKSIDD